ncbi:tRNA(Ile)-lysidine synthetase [Candidatus Neoehrlichia lotoris str. RAC413]|uniref:tRNA(Ile)-lysidine synthase n=2 Tax=Candidatus Neoehrlichia procyonis TaxID=467750 RepID=A0A0F3NMZ4_9RICK|nr:tRNA(Ile)-lysidine synthetase [Candidatus Neoehrlichia lotoris str. RAC413]
MQELNLQKNYAVAVSGGVDSITLLYLISIYHNVNTKFHPIILTVNHGLREEATQETLFVYNTSQKLKLTCQILNWNGIKPTSNIQSAARTIRYSLLHEWCDLNSIKYLITAHHKDDQAETIFMRLERGSGLDGLLGMQERSRFYTIEILRPFLCFTKKEILHYALQKQLNWIEDPSNTNTKYKRTLYRNFIKVSKNPDVLVNRLHTTAIHIKRAVNCILYYVHAALNDCLEFNKLGFINIKLNKFNEVPEEIALRLFSYSLMVIGKKSYKPRYEKFIKLFHKIKNDLSIPPHTFYNCKIIRNKDNTISIIKEVASIKTQYINPYTKETIIWDNRFLLKIHNISAEQVSITPLSNNPIPIHLKKLYKEAVYSLPILKSKDKILAYPLQNNNIDNIPVISIEDVLIKRNIVNLVYSQFN